MKDQDSESKNNFRRLLLAKQLYLHGLEHSYNKGSLNKMISIHNFHNAIEITLRAIFLQYEIRAEKQLNIEFEAMLNEVDNFYLFKKSGKRLPYRQELRNLNQLRNMVQHHAVEPETSTMEDWRVFTKRFLIEAFKDYFDKSFDSISSLDLIADDNLRKLLEISGNYLKNKDIVQCVINAKVAFEYAIQKILNEVTHKNFHRLSGFNINQSLDNPMIGYIDDTIKEINANIYESIKETKHFLVMLSIGIELAEYKKIEKLTPKVKLSSNGYPHLTQTNKIDSLEDATWMYHFTTNCITHWQLLDLEPALPTWSVKGFNKYIDEQQTRLTRPLNSDG